VLEPLVVGVVVLPMSSSVSLNVPRGSGTMKCRRSWEATEGGA
jgi:hypothetical protein